MKEEQAQQEDEEVEEPQEEQAVDGGFKSVTITARLQFFPVTDSCSRLCIEQPGE